MYATYQYNAGATQANVLNDLIKLITGETNKANLSADCFQAATSIISTDAAGWSLYDAAAGTNIQCVRVLNQDGATYKYALLQFATTTALSMAMSESWNATTHVGTNNTVYSASSWSSAAGGFFFLHVTPKNIFIAPVDTATNKVYLAVMEFSRDTIPAGYPCAGVVSAFAGLSNSNGTASPSVTFPRTKNPTSTGDTAPNVNIGFGAIFFLPASNAIATQVFRTAAEVTQAPAYRIGISLTSGSFCHLGANYDILNSYLSIGNERDTIVYNGVTYVIFKTNTANSSLLIPQR